MGPLDAQPPMVTAQGYNQPVGAPTSPMDQNAMIAELLRRRNAAQKQAQLSAGNSQMWGNDFQRPQFTNTIRGGNGAPDQVVVNWGDILGKGVSNYMGAKERKQSVESQDQVKDLNNQFMQTTLSNDPTAQKLYSAVQAGVPGADKALTDHMAPKKQSLAVLTQFISGGGDPEMASSLAKQFGVDPDIAFKAAQYQAKNAEQKATDKFAQQAALLAQKQEGAQNMQDTKPTKSGYTPAELAAMPIADRIKAIQSAGPAGRETAESKARGKAKADAELELPKTDYAMDNINRVIDLTKKADFWPGNMGMKSDKLTTNPNNVNARQALAQLTLDANGGKLGAGFSNADRDFMREAQVNFESGNMKTAVYQLSQLVTRLQARQKELRQAAGQAEAAPASTSSAGGAAPSFDDVWKEVGGE